MNVEVVPADTGQQFAGAIRLDPSIASTLTDVLP
jgi:hypothetical protein